MTIFELGAVGEFVGAIGVVITLGYLAFQIRQNTLQLKSQSRFHVLEGMNTDADRLFELDHYDFFWEVTQADELSGKQLGRFRLLMNSWITRLEMMFFEIQEGTLAKSFESSLRYRLFTV